MTKWTSPAAKEHVVVEPLTPAGVRSGVMGRLDDIMLRLCEVEQRVARIERSAEAADAMIEHLPPWLIVILGAVFGAALFGLGMWAGSQWR
jgi:hypothetical protein